MLAQPHDLAGGETGDQSVGGGLQHRVETAHLPGDPQAFLLTALVVPQNRPPDHGAVRVEGDETVHLPAESDSHHLAAPTGQCGGDLTDTGIGGLPPILGILFAPAEVLAEKGITPVGGGEHRPVRVHRHHLAGRGADIDAQMQPRRVGHLRPRTEPGGACTRDTLRARPYRVRCRNHCPYDRRTGRS